MKPEEIKEFTSAMEEFFKVNNPWRPIRELNETPISNEQLENLAYKLVEYVKEQQELAWNAARDGAYNRYEQQFDFKYFSIDDWRKEQEK